MSWVKQKKILKCLLFFSAGTRTGSGERQVSLSPPIERQTAYKALMPLPVPECLSALSPRGDSLETLSDGSLQLQLGDKYSQESDKIVRNKQFLLLITLSTKVSKV